MTVRRSAGFALALLVACTGEAPTPRDRATSSPGEAPALSPAPSATLALVTRDAPDLRSYVEGIRFAAGEVDARGMLDLEIVESPSIGAALESAPAAVLVVGDPAAVSDARTTIEQARTPVVAVGGDLYSGRELFRHAFQTAVPVRWQAGVFASYFLEDRGHDRTALVTTLDNEEVVSAAFNEAWTEEGGSLERIVRVDATRLRSVAQAGTQLGGLDSVIFVGPATAAARLAGGISAIQTPPQLAISSEGIDVAFARTRAAAGTVTCYPYTWSGWADMLPRVHAFRERFTAVMEHYPASLEQEGYDAVMALADALQRTGGRGGDSLVRELETFREETYSSLPVRLGPDDHVFAEQSHLGLFAIEGPVDTALPPPEASSLLPWRPILRTFTTDGEKVNFLDRDKRIFFPFWRPKRPTPKYWRSEYGIVSRQSDPLH